MPQVRVAALTQTKYATRERTTTNEENMIYYSEDYPYEYVIVADGENSISLDIPVGAKIIQIEKETKPMAASSWSWNAVSLILTLTATDVYAGQTLFILYKIIKTTL